MRTPAGGDRDEAQRRADRIRAFRAELSDLEREGVFRLGDAERAALAGHHDALLEQLARQFDVDRSAAEKQLSLGMRVASLVGAVAFCAAVVTFFHRIWGDLSFAAQMMLLVVAPVAALALTAVAAARERTLYVASLFALVALAAFGLDVTLAGQALNLPPSPGMFLVIGLFALLLALGYELKLQWTIALVSLSLFAAAVMASAAGWAWQALGDRPELFLATGGLTFALGFIPAVAARAGFAWVCRLLGTVTVLLASFLLSVGVPSALPVARPTAEVVHQVLGFGLAAGTIGLGLVRGWPDLARIGAGFFAVMLFARMVDWFWAWLPRYLFFLIVGATALALLYLLGRLRGRTAKVA